MGGVLHPVVSLDPTANPAPLIAKKHRMPAAGGGGRRAPGITNPTGSADHVHRRRQRYSGGFREHAELLAGGASTPTTTGLAPIPNPVWVFAFAHGRPGFSWLGFDETQIRLRTRCQSVVPRKLARLASVIDSLGIFSTIGFTFG